MGSGLWTIHCGPPPAVSSVSEPAPERHSIQLQVLDADLEFLVDWEFLGSGTALASPTPTQVNPGPATEVQVPMSALELNPDAVASIEPTLESTLELSLSPGLASPAEVSPVSPPLTLPTFAKGKQPVQTQPSPGLILPPELCPPDQSPTPALGPQLPTFIFNPMPSRTVTSDAQASGAQPSDPREPVPAPAPPLSPAEDLISIDQAFASLALHQRFLQTLSNLALTAEVTSPVFSPEEIAPDPTTLLSVATPSDNAEG